MSDKKLKFRLDYCTYSGSPLEYCSDIARFKISHPSLENYELGRPFCQSHFIEVFKKCIKHDIKPFVTYSYTCKRCVQPYYDYEHNTIAMSALCNDCKNGTTSEKMEKKTKPIDKSAINKPLIGLCDFKSSHCFEVGRKVSDSTTLFCTKCATSVKI